MWELDTRYTKDGQLVVFHDETLERTTDVAKRPEFASRAPWNVRDFTLAELKTLDAGAYFAETDPFHTVAAGEVSPETLQSYAGERIPTLEEALRLVKKLNWKVNVEIKDHEGASGHESIAEAVCSLVRELGMAESTVLSSFQHQYLIQAAKYLPEMPRAALVKEPRPENASAVCKAAKSVFYHPKQTILLPGDVEELAHEGIMVNVWTVNSVEDMERMVALGVHGIITDFPERLREL